MPETDMPDRVPLVLVILAFAIIQPVGMLLLGIRKLQNTGILIKEGRSMLTISAVFIILFFSLLDYPELSNFLTIFYFIGSCGVIALLFSLLIFRQGQRCEKYKSAIMTHHLTQISDIASAVKLPEQRVCKDLRKMMSARFFPHPELDIENMIFRADIFEPGIEKKRTQKCKGCGATGVLVEGRTGICEYCGRAIE